MRAIKVLSMPQMPWKSMMLALLLFGLGTILLTIAGLLYTGQIGNADHDDRLVPLFVLGSLVFIPGFYHVRIAFWIWRGAEGYDWTLIPDMD